jgi:hypothetical protein
LRAAGQRRTEAGPREGRTVVFNIINQQAVIAEEATDQILFWNL